MKFLKNYWYPLVLSSEIKANKPYAITLLGDPLVLFRDSSGGVICLHDACPHQGTPLSLGVVRDGNIECAYHGWQFGDNGRCKKIPSLPDNAKIPKRADCRFAYPTEERGGVVWVFAGSQDKVTPLCLPEGFAVEGWRYDTIVRDLNVSHHLMMAGTLDYTHVIFTHQNSLARPRKMLNPMEVVLVEYERGLRAKLRDSRVEDGFDVMTMAFEPPCMIQIAVDLKKPGWKLLLNQYPVPLAENKTRLFMFICRNWLKWNPLVTRALISQTNKILDEDAKVVNGQFERHMSGDGSYHCSVTPDILSIRYRQWYDRQTRILAKKTQLAEKSAQ